MSLNCLKCGSENLIHYKELVEVSFRKISSKGRIYKTTYSKFKSSFNCPEYIDCDDCEQRHGYLLTGKEGYIAHLFIID